jgi:hypothetical protein
MISLPRVTFLAAAFLVLAGGTGAEHPQNAHLGPRPLPELPDPPPGAPKSGSDLIPDHRADERETGARFSVNTHRAISNRALRHAGGQVDAFLINELLLTSGILTGSPDGPLDQRLEDGAEHEDDSPFFGLVRPRNHFYDPTTGGGLSDIANGMSSLRWAFEAPGNDFDWTSTRERYLEALTASDPGAREQALGDTFYGLGHVIHLLEDLGQPQHTRNDAHITGLPGAPFEEYCSTHYGTAAAVGTLGAAPIPTFGTLPPAVGNIPPEFVAFWDTEQYTGQRFWRGFSDTPGLAEFSHVNFITDDTMFGDANVVFMRRPAPAPGLFIWLDWTFGNGSTQAIHDHPNPSLWHTNILDFYPTETRITLEREGEYPGNNPLHYVDLEVRDVSGTIVHTTPDLFMINDAGEMGFDDVCFQSWAEVLIPQSVGYAAGLLNYFFRGTITLGSPSLSWNETDMVNELEITNGSGEDFGSGTWSLYVDDMNDVRMPVAIDDGGYAGLSDGSSFTITFPEMLCEGGGLYTLVFDGEIGNEEGAIAVKSFYGPPETWVGTYSVPATDLCTETAGTVVVTVDRPTPEGYEIVATVDFGAPGAVYASGTCASGILEIATLPECGHILSGTIEGGTITDAMTCCWFCPLDPPPDGPYFCGTVSNLRRTN